MSKVVPQAGAPPMLPKVQPVGAENVMELSEKALVDGFVTFTEN